MSYILQVGMGPRNIYSCDVVIGTTYGPPPFQPCHVHWTACNTERAHMVRQQHLLVRTTLPIIFCNYLIPSYLFINNCWSCEFIVKLYNAAYVGLQNKLCCIDFIRASWPVKVWNSFHRYGNTGSYRSRIDVTFAGEEWYASLQSLTSVCTRLIVSDRLNFHLQFRFSPFSTPCSARYWQYPIIWNPTS